MSQTNLSPASFTLTMSQLVCIHADLLFVLFWVWSPLSALKTARPLSAQLLEILIEFWLCNKKQYFWRKSRAEKKGGGGGGSGCVTFCFPLSCFGRRSLVRSAFAAMGRTEISLPSRLASLHALLPPLSSLLCLALPVGFSPRSPVAVSVVSRSQLERKSGHDEAAQVPGASMKSLQRRDD